MTFAERYGPWALVAGASQGLGAAYATEVASRGVNVVMVAEAADPLESMAAGVAKAHGVETRAAVVDLADADAAEKVAGHCDDLDVGLLVYNAAIGYVGDFLDGDVEVYEQIIDVNCRGPLLLSRWLAPRLVERGRGGIVLMSSASGLAGTSTVAAYSASKAFDLTLGEALWRELGPHDVDVVAPVAGTIDTPNLRATNPDPDAMALPPAPPEAVARDALDALGHGPMAFVGGDARDLLVGLDGLPRRQLVDLLGAGTDAQYGIERD